jgi:phage terminase large subunit GpA-like protein
MLMEEVRRKALAILIPPPKLRLSEWIEKTIVLPAGVSALPGKVRLFEYQRGIADAISDDSIERIVLLKSARIGFTTLLTAAIGSFVVNDPCPIILLLPAEADCRDAIVSDIEPTFSATPCLRAALTADRNDEDRNTLLSKRFPGGSLKVIPAKSPRGLRRHTCRILFVDECDAMERAGPEGNPLLLAERRTMSFRDRKIVIGSTPLFEDSSHVLRAYGESDQRQFEVPCPSCGGFTEILWGMIEWQPDLPETAAFRCPHCKELIDERHKPAMVSAGAWRITRPEIRGYAGFRANALISTLPNASWGKLAAEFLKAKDEPSELQTFVNTVLAQGWSLGGSEIDDGALRKRAEPFGLDKIPREVLIVTAGVDGADDRLEVSICGWARDGVCFVLGHIVIWGTPDDDTTWYELDELLKTRWKHRGGSLGIDACAIDSGDGQHTSKIYDFAFPRANRRIMAIKGMAGARPAIQVSKSKVNKRGNFWIVGVDSIKLTIFTRLQRSQLIRFSTSLEPVYFEQLASEKRVVRYKAGQPVRRFERISGRARAEALDCLVYAFAARSACPVQLDRREAELSGKRSATPNTGEIASMFAHAHKGEPR